MRQRAMIAMAHRCNPDVLIADEPTTALDVTIQAQILDVMRELQDAATTSGVILITHDLGVVAEMADRVMVMYGGRKVEYGPVDEIFDNSASPVHVGAAGARCRGSTRPRRRGSCRSRAAAVLIAPAAGLPVRAALPPPRCAGVPRHWPAHEHGRPATTACTAGSPTTSADADRSTAIGTCRSFERRCGVHERCSSPRTS